MTQLTALERLRSGRYLPSSAVKSATRLVIDATDHGDAEMADLATRFVQVQLKFPYIKPVFLVAAMNPSELTRAGFLYETVTPEVSWRELGIGGTYREYKERRFHEMLVVYLPSRSGKVLPGEEVPRWMYER